jgi:peptidoglycan/LPS O-acetylase OafA/YrhL
MKYIYYPTYARLDGLVTGVGLALVRIFRPAWWANVTSHGNILLACGVATIVAALGLCHYDYPNPSLPASVLFCFPTLALGFGLLVASAVCDRSVLKARIPGAAALATLAFSLYLTHKSVAHAVHLLLPSLTANADWEATGIYAISCLTFASLLYFAIERPFLRLRIRLSEKQAALLVEREVRFDPAL